MTANYLNPDFFSRRANESEIAYQMRIRPYLAHREDAEAEAREAHAEFRAQQEVRTQGTGYGLAGDMSPQQRAAALNSRGFGSGRHLEANDHLLAGVSVPGSVSVRRVYAAEVEQDRRPGRSPLVEHLRSSGTGIF